MVFGVVHYIFVACLSLGKDGEMSGRLDYTKHSAPLRRRRHRHQPAVNMDTASGAKSAIRFRVFANAPHYCRTGAYWQVLPWLVL